MEALVKYPWNRSNSVFQASSFSPRSCSNGWRLRSIVLGPSYRLQTPLHVPLCTITNTVTGMLSNIFPILAWDSMLSHKTKLTLKTGAHLIHSHRHHSCLECSTWFKLPQTLSSKTRAYKRLVPIPGVLPLHNLHNTLNIETIQDFHPSTCSQIFCSLSIQS